MPANSPSFDCDDGTLLMYERFSGLGIRSSAIVGNLKVSGEKLQEIDHVWLIADIGGRRVAFDWGEPRFDAQHYEGYTISYGQLLEQVMRDQRSVQLAAR